MGENTKRLTTKTMVTGAILTAIVVILQFMGAFIHLGQFSVSLVLIPIVVGSAVCGAGMGAWLGLVFGVVVLLSGDAGAFLAVNLPGTLITVLLKGIGCGVCAGLMYKLLNKYNKYVAVIAAAIVCPVVNTGIFLLGCHLFFMETIAGWAVGSGFEADLSKYMILVLVGGNFIFELALNIIISPVILRIIKIGKKH